VTRAGFGPAPDGFFSQLIYAWTVVREKRAVLEKLAGAKARLRRSEEARDERLALLSEQKRGEIERQERFLPLFAQADQLSQQLAQMARELESSDEQGILEMRSIEAQIQASKAKRMPLEANRDLLAQASQALLTNAARLRAANKRLQIEERNLTERYQSQGVPVSQFRLQVAEVASKSAQIAAELAEEERRIIAANRSLAQAEDEVRLQLAEQQRHEAALEAHLVAAEGAGAERSGSLRAVRMQRVEVLALIGRTVLELRGSIPVEPQIRAQLNGLDSQVMEAACVHRTLRLAIDSIDQGAYTLGRIVALSGALLGISGLLYLLFR
jgi:chromosome segregation ATPase